MLIIGLRHHRTANGKVDFSKNVVLDKGNVIPGQKSYKILLLCIWDAASQRIVEV